MNHFFPKKNSAGFTLVEVLVAVSIFALLGGLTLVSFVNSRNVRDTLVWGQNVVSVLKLAESRSAGGQDNSVWGVHLEQARFVLFRGASYALATSTQVYTLPLNLEIANIALAGGGSDVVFGRLDGKTNQSGSFDLRVRGSLANVFSITIDGAGRIYQTGTSPAVLGTRIIDARHRAFTLGWSIRSAITMKLTFSNPPNADVVQSIVMDPPPLRNIFDWSGSVAVAGINQILRVHATSIIPTDTVLHVDRDCRWNNKKMKLEIDTKLIATYEADCKTITVGPFGGSMVEP